MLQFVRIAVGNYEDIRLWSVRFQLLRPMETLPVPYEVVLEKQVSPTYHLEGRGRPQDHAQIVCTISGEGAFRHKEKVYKLTPGMAFMAQLGDPDTAYYYPGTRRIRGFFYGFHSTVSAPLKSFMRCTNVTVMYSACRSTRAS